MNINMYMTVNITNVIFYSYSLFPFSSVILLRDTYHRAPRYGDMRTWMEGLLAGGTRSLAEASNLVGYKDAQQDLSQTGFVTITQLFNTNFNNVPYRNKAYMVGHNNI